MRTLAAIAVALAFWASAVPAWGAGLSFASATSQYQSVEDSGRYHPLNLLDEDPATIWCEGAPGDGEGEGIEIAFKRPQRIDRVVLTPTAKTGRIVSEVRISDGSRVVNVRVGTEPAAEVFSRPLEGTRFTITIAAVGAASPDAAVPADVVCLADALLYLRESLFGGSASKIRYDRNLERLVGMWNGGALGAPEQSLIFSLDGTWEWIFTPLMGGKGKKAVGEYRFRGDRLLMRAGEVGRWSDMQFRYRRVKVDPDEMGAPAGDYDEITLGKGVTPELVGAYNNARFQ